SLGRSSSASTSAPAGLNRARQWTCLFVSALPALRRSITSNRKASPSTCSPATVRPSSIGRQTILFFEEHTYADLSTKPRAPQIFLFVNLADAPPPIRAAGSEANAHGNGPTYRSGA